MVGQGLIHCLAAEGKFIAGKIEGTMQANVDQARDAAFDVGGGRRLVHIDLGQQFRRKVGQ